MMHVKRIALLVLPVLILALVGCQTVDNGYKKYDPTRRYLNTSLYFSEPLEVPATLGNAKLDDYYPIPDVAIKEKTDKPSLAPPSNSMNEEV